MSDKPTTLKQAQVYEIVKNMSLKASVTWVLLCVFIAAFLFLIFSFFYFEKSYVSIVTGAFDAILAPTMYKMCSHYFGASKAAKKIEED